MNVYLLTTSQGKLIVYETKTALSKRINIHRNTIHNKLLKNNTFQCTEGTVQLVPFIRRSVGGNHKPFGYKEY